MTPRLIAIVAALVIIIAGIVGFGHARYQAGVNHERQLQQAAVAQEREERRRVDWEVRKDYESRIAELNALAGMERRGPAIHCVLRAPGEVRSGSDPAGPADGADGESAVRAAQDLRPELVRVGATCETLRQHLIAIKARQGKLAGD